MKLRHKKNIKDRKTKRCCKCKRYKLLDKFFNNKAHLFGKSPYCKICHGKDNSIRRNKNKNKPEYIQKSKLKYQEKKQYHLESSKEYYKKNRENTLKRHKKWRDNNKEYNVNYHKEWYLKNRIDKLNKNAEWEKNQMKNNPIFKIKKNMRIRIYNALKHNHKSKTTILLLGCSIDFFKSHIEKKFAEGMTWHNYGSVWHVDHIKPCAKFDLSKEEEQIKCFNYKNLQPLFALDNIKKKDKYITTKK